MDEYRTMLDVVGVVSAVLAVSKLIWLADAKDYIRNGSSANEILRDLPDGPISSIYKRFVAKPGIQLAEYLYKE